MVAPIEATNQNRTADRSVWVEDRATPGVTDTSAERFSAGFGGISIFVAITTKLYKTREV
jgi:hypothetical protein